MTDQQPITGEQFRAIHTVTLEVADERLRQHEKWGQQDHPDGTGPDRVWAYTGPAEFVAASVRDEVDRQAREGGSNFADILLEEVAEAFAVDEDDPAKLRAELIQVAAAAVQWAEAIDRRGATA